MTAWLSISLCALAATLHGSEHQTAKTHNPDTEKLLAVAEKSTLKGLDWLSAHQKENGSWSNENYPAMTALGLWAFARSDPPRRNEVCAKAASFIERFVQQDGGIYKPATGGRGSGGLSTYNTAICMIALHTYNKSAYAEILLNARKFMASSQLLGDSPGAGGFGYDRPTKRTAQRGRPPRGDLSNTGWAAYAMRQTQDLEDLRPGGQRVDIDWDATLQFIEKLQNRDKDDPEHYGGFGYTIGGERGGSFVSEKDGTVQLRGYGSMTYAGLETMIFAQVDRTDPRVRSALRWAARHWSVDENPGMGRKGLFYYYNIMAKALSLCGEDTLHSPDGDPIPWKRDLIRKLTAIQREDGSWINTDHQFWEGDPMLVTAYSILALQYAVGE